MFANYENVSYDPSLVSVASNATITYGPTFLPTTQASGNLSTAGQITDIGTANGSGSTQNPGPAPQVVWTVPAIATAAGMETFTPSFDSVSGHDSLLFGGTPAPVPQNQIQFINGTLQINFVSIASISSVSKSAPVSGTTPFVFTVSLSAPSTSALTVDYATADGTATAASGAYTAVPTTTLTFPAGTTSELVTVLVNGASINQPQETFSVLLSSPSSNAALGTSIGLGTIFRSPNVDIFPTSETVTNVTTGQVFEVFSVNLSAATGDTVTVPFFTSDQTAHAGTDYVGVSSTLTFSPGNTSQTVSVALIANPQPALSETYLLNLGTATNGVVTGGPATGTISPAVTVSINDVGLPKPTSGFTPFVFTVSLSTASPQPIVTTFTTRDGTATFENSDYVSQTGTLTFAPGQTTQTITVQVVGNTNVEPSESFFVDVTPISGAAVGTFTGTGTITSAGTPTFAINNVSISGANGGNAAFSVSLVSGTLTQTASVSFATSNNTALANVDYLPVTGILTFVPGGPTTQTILVPIVANPGGLADKTFFVTLSSNTAGTAISMARGTGTIVEQGLSIADTTISASTRRRPRRCLPSLCRRS